MWGLGPFKPENTYFLWEFLIKSIGKIGDKYKVNCMLYGEKENYLILATTYTGQTTKTYAYSIQFLTKLLQRKKPFESQWIEKIIGILQNCGMFHFWENLNQHQNVDIIYIQLMYIYTHESMNVKIHYT